MYDIVLADDETWELIGLKKLIARSQLPLRVVGEAENGIVALQELEEKRPQILITDIRMPGLSGVQLLQQVQEKGLDVDVIILSGYAEFSYAQEAVRCAVENGILSGYGDGSFLPEGRATRAQAAVMLERYVNYLGYIGANQEVTLAHMAATFGVSVNRLCKDLRRMLSKGILPTGYLDLAEGKLFLTEMGYRRPEPREWAGEQSRSEQEDDLLRQIRQVNDEIPDKAMSAKIRRIEEISGKILAYQKTHPNREAQLRSFLNYYLPTTLKILRAYAQLEAQGIEGENISAAKARIEGMMDQVVAGFEKQLDRLFQDDAMDITSDVEVLENMLRKDGLSDDGMTMPM